MSNDSFWEGSQSCSIIQPIKFSKPLQAVIFPPFAELHQKNDPFYFYFFPNFDKSFKLKYPEVSKTRSGILGIVLISFQNMLMLLGLCYHIILFVCFEFLRDWPLSFEVNCMFQFIG